jgi:hypothetical protein
LRAAGERLSLGKNALPALDEHAVWYAYTSAELIPHQLDVGLAEVGKRYGV